MAAEHQKHAIGVFPTYEEAENAIKQLQAAEFPMSQVSVVAKQAEQQGEIAGVEVEDAERRVSNDSAKTGATAGGIGGAIVGALEAAGLPTFVPLLFPGAGQVLVFGTVAANALATAVSGGVIGAVGGGIVGGLVGWGVPKGEAEAYRDRLSEGRYLLLIEGSHEQIDSAEAIVTPLGIQKWAIYEAATGATR
mgnify:CR=1 FL=1